MGNQDKLFTQIKKAAENAEAKEFPAMESVWSRVESKLDKKELAKENTVWKKIAVAACALLVLSLGYHYFTKDTTVSVPKNNAVAIDTTKALVIPKPDQQVAVADMNLKTEEKAAPIGGNTAASGQNQIVIHNNYTFTTSPTSDSVTIQYENKLTLAPSKATTSFPVYDARGVVYEDDRRKAGDEEARKEVQSHAKKLDPLVVVDDKVSKGTYNPDDMETMEVLTDPLYIINGVYYTEKELFGPNPTSPYAPLSRLEIETISILQNEKATAIYGEKGKKGVVIITTKTGKPSFKKP